MGQRQKKVGVPKVGLQFRTFFKVSGNFSDEKFSGVGGSVGRWVDWSSLAKGPNDAPSPLGP